MVNVVSENPGGIDLCNPSSGGFIQFRGEDEKLLADLDYGEIPNYDNLPEAWHNVPFLEGNEDGLFRYISSQGLAYNTEPVDEFSSWDEIEQSEYGDLISLHATPSVRFANAAAAAGKIYQPDWRRCCLQCDRRQSRGPTPERVPVLDIG